MKKTNLVFKILLIALICAGIGIATNKSFAAGYQDARAVNSGVKITDGAHTKTYYKIVSSDAAYTDFCMKGGAYLYGTPTYNASDLYSIDSPLSHFKSIGNYNSAMWLIDNAYITSVDDATKAILKENLKSQMNDEVAIAALDQLSDEQIIAVQGCVLWRFTKNVDAIKDNASVVIPNDSTKTQAAQRLQNHLLVLADSHNNYTHKNTDAKLSKGNNFTINTSTRKAGPFTSNVELNTSNTIIMVNGKKYTENFTVQKSDNQYYIILPEGSIVTGEGVTNSVEIKYKGIKTTAYILQKTKYQTLVAITKSVVSLSANASSTTPIPELDLALVKTIASFTDPNTGEATQVDRFNPSTSVSTTGLDNKTSKDASYKVYKSPLKVQAGSKITYKIYVYNEGESPATAKIVDYLPSGLKLVNTDIWEEDGTVKINEQTFTKIVLKNETRSIPAYKTGKISYDVQKVICMVNNNVTEGVELRNYAEILTEKGSSNQKDRDSVPNTVEGKLKEYISKVESITNSSLFKSSYNQQDDDDFERIIVVKKGFDLALRKYISKINDEATNREPLLYGKYGSETQPDTDMYVQYLKTGGTTFEYYHPKDTLEVAKGDYITYTIRVYNESLLGDYEGYAYRIIDSLPEGLEYDEQKTIQANAQIDWISSINCNTGGRTVIITAKEGEKYNLQNILKYCASQMMNGTGSYYQEVHVVCKVSENATEGINLINEAHIAEYYIEGIGVIDALIEQLNQVNVTDRDSTIGSTVTDTHNAILQAAEQKLEDYTLEFEQYVPGVQDDDDFDSVKIREIIDQTFCFNLKKVESPVTPLGPDTGMSTISGVEITFDDNQEAVTGQDGIAKLYTDKNIPEEWYTQGKIISTKIIELSSVNNEYVPINGPIYAYYTFKVENDAVKVDEVKLSYTEYKNITKDQFNKLSDKIIANLKNGGAVTVSISKSLNSNDITVQVPNPLITGTYQLQLQKVDANSVPLEGAEFTINDTQSQSTDENGNILITSSLTGEGWSYDEITEKDIADITDGKKYIKLSESIIIYRYTEIVDYKYKITKIGFGQTEEEYIDISNGTITKTEEVKLENGKTVTVTLVATTVNGVTTLKLIIPNNSQKYKLQIQKVDLEQNPLSGVTFKVNEETTQPTDANGLVQVLEKELTNTTDVYTISEVNINNQYIKLASSVNIYVSASSGTGKLNASFNQKLSTVKTKVVKLEDGTEVTLNVDTIEDEDKNVIVQLVIPNKDSPSNYKFLLKKLDAYTGKQLTEAVEFNVQEIKPDITINADIVINASDIITTKNVDVIGQAELDNKPEIEKGTTYRYRITEEAVPENYVKTLTKDIIVKINIDEEGLATAYIERYNGKLLSQEAQEKYAKIAVGENNEVVLEITNVRKIEYILNLMKTDTNGDLIYTDVTNPGAEFNIGIDATDIQGTSNEQLDNIIVNGKYSINRKNVVEGAELSAKIEEIQSKVGYINLLEGKYLIVKYKIEKDTRKLKVVTQEENNFLIYNSETDEVINKADAQELYNSISVVANNSTSIPQINIQIPNEKIEGDYSLQLIKTGEDENTRLNNVDFSVNNNTYTTNNQGIAQIASGKEINVNNVNTKDVYTIRELNLGDNKYIKLANVFTLYVTKGIVTDGYTSTGAVKQKYAATGISFETNGTPSGQAETNAILSNGKTVNVTAKIENGTIKITVPNTKITGKYNLNIKKVSSQDPNEVVGGAKFSVLDSIQVPHNVTTDTVTGIGTAVTNKEIFSEGTDIYMITETEVPAGYRLIKYHKIIARVTTELSEDGNSYVPTGVTLALSKTAGGEESDKEEDLLNKGLKYSIENDTITITIPNQETTDYNFVIKKVDADDNTEFLSTARFTIDGPNGNIITDQALTNGVYTGQAENVNVDSEYLYQIRETAVPVGYQDILNGAYLELAVVVDTEGNIDTQNSRVDIRCEDINIGISEIISKVRAISQYIHELEYDQQTKTVTLTIENPKITKDFSLNLVKHELYSDKQVSGAQFELKQSTDNGTTYGQVINTFTTPVTGDLTSVENAIAGSKYYYQLEETQTPENYVSEFKNIQFMVDVSSTGVITSQITKIYDGTNWVDYESSTHQNYISLNLEENNKIGISWANSAQYKIKILKNFYSGTGTSAIPGAEATFKVERIWPGNTVLYNGELNGNQCEIIEDTVNANSTYRYRITETETPTGFSKLIENVPIILTIRTDNNGKIISNISTTGGSSWKPESTVGLSVATLQAIGKMIKVDILDNEVTINVDNYYENYYQVQLVKQDKNGNTKQGATFAINMPNGTNFDADNTTAGVQNPVTDSEGGISLGYRDIATNAIETYEITEIIPPSGFNLLEGKITLDVDLTGVTVAADLDSSDLTLNYEDNNGNIIELEGLTAEVTIAGTTPIIRVIIPNEGKEHLFKILKVDGNDNPVTAEEQENGFYDGAYFSVSRTLVSGANIAAGTIANKDLLTNEVLLDGTFQELAGSYINGQYTYAIQENKSKTGLSNILSGYIISLIVKTDAEGNVIEAEQGNTEKTRFTVIEPHTNTTVTSQFADYISLTVTKDENGTDVVQLKIKNPANYLLSLKKNKSNGKPLSTARLAAVEVNSDNTDGQTYPMENISSMYTNKREIAIGETQQWKVYELATQEPYVNVLGTNYVLITVEKTVDGLILKNYKIMTAEGTELATTNIAYSYVTVGITKENDTDIVEVEVQNPLTYNFELTKYDTNGNEINAADLQVVRGNDTFTNEGTSRVSIQEPIVDIGDLRPYTIQELDVDAPYVNILQGKSIRVWAHMKEDSTVEVALFDIIDNNTQETLSKTDIAYSYVTYNIVEVNGIQTIQVKIENPFTYIFKLTKNDTAGNPLTGAYLRIEKGGKIYSNSGAAVRTLTEKQVDIGTITTYKITELGTTTPHVNILKNKYIIMEVLMQGTGRTKVNSFKIYNNDGTEVETSDISYAYITYNITNSEGIDTVNLVVENPLSYKLNILKTDTQDNELQGPNIKITQNPNEYNTNGNPNYTIAESIIDIGTITEYTITETETVEPYVNILEGKYIKLGVLVKSDETLEINKFKIYNASDDTEISETASIYEFVSAQISGTTVQVKIQNPVTFKVQLNKVDSDGEVLEGANFEIDSSIVSEQNAEYSAQAGNEGITQIDNSGKITGTTTETGIISYDETWVSEGIYEYEIKEIESPGNQYVNILDGYKIYARVKVFANGNITLVDKNGNERKVYYIEKEDGTAAPRGLYRYVDISVVNNTLTASVLGEIENPVKYNVNIDKTLAGSQNDLALQDVGLQVISSFSGTHDLFTNVYGKVNFEESAVDAGTYTYFVTETESAGEGFVNILEGYYIKVNLQVLANGEIQTLDNSGNAADGAYYIYKKIEGIQSYELINPEDTNLDDYISVNISNLENIYTLNMNIENPQEYIIQLNKTDKTTEEKMNDVKFNMNITDENNQNVILKSSKNLGEEIDISNLITENYDGMDGVIRIENILFEKVGIYTITLTEEEPKFYQDTGDIKIKYEIVENNGKYEIINVEVLEGEYYVKSAVVASESVRRLIINAQNEKLSGSYNLEVVKQDPSDNPLENIGFNINSESEDKKTNAEGKISYSNSLYDTGWSYDVIKETDSKHASNGKDYASVEEIVIYKYTEIINNKYVVTKIGFSDEPGYYVDVPETGTTTITKTVKTENPDNPVTVELLISAAQESIVSCKLTIENPEVEGKYEIKILKVDQDEQPIEGVTFKVNGNLTAPTGADGIVNLGTKVIEKPGTDKYTISEINVNGSYIPLKDPVALSVYSIRAYGKYIAVHTYFDENHTSATKTVLLADGKTEVTLSLAIKDGVVTVTIPNKKVKFDLALQKFITGVNQETIQNREPKFVNTNGEYSYVPKYEDLEPVTVANSDIVTYTLRVYNEADGECYATEIMDEIPEGLEFVPYENGDQSVNDKYDWIMFKLAEQGENLEGANTREYNGKVYVQTDDITKAEFIRTNYLSKNSESNNTTSEGQETPNLLKGFDNTQMEQPDYRDVQVQFKVNYNVTSIEDTKRIIVNYAQITKDSDKNGDDITDIDSEPNVWTDGEDDQDKEKIKVQYFDMALVKWVSEASVVENGIETVYPGNKETDIPEPVLKVDLKKSKINDVVVKFKYQIKVTNEGEIAGYIKEISDYIPDGLKFVKEDNIEFKWEEQEGKIVTPYLENTLLQPDESATVTVVLTWINGENNLGLKVNIAEISKDYNDKDDTSDIDSTPDNKVDGEDDIDNAPVMLSVQTGDNNVMVVYIAVALGTVTILSIGILLVKKYVL